MRLPNFHGQFTARIFLESKIDWVCANIVFGNRDRLQDLAARCLFLPALGRRWPVSMAMHWRHRGFRSESNQAPQDAMIRDRDPRHHRQHDEK